MSNSSSFKPHPYTFILVDCYDHPMIVDYKFKDKIIAQCPPFHILLDHTIAVLWKLFSSGKQCSLRSSQICWALKFLEGMQNDSRAKLYSEDVRNAIRCLESAFVNCISSESVPEVTQENEDSVYMTPMCSKGSSIEGGEVSYVASSAAPRFQAENRLQSLLLRDMLKDGQ